LSTVFVAAASFTVWHDTYLSMNGREADLRFANIQNEVYRSKLSQPPQIVFNPKIFVQSPSKESAEDAHRWMREFIEHENKEKQVSNSVLAKQAIALALRLRTLEAQYQVAYQQVLTKYEGSTQAALLNGKASGNDQFVQEMADQQNLTNQRNFTYQSTMAGEARFLVDQMLARLPPQPKGSLAAFFDMGSLGGPHPLFDKADYIESLAKQLAP
jgi:hypothetical protein